MKLNFNFESRENHFLTSGISHPGWYLSPRFTVFQMVLFGKKLSDPLSNSIFSNFVGLDFDRDHITVATNLTRCCYLADFKSTSRPLLAHSLNLLPVKHKSC